MEKREESNYFIAILYKQSLNIRLKYNIISIKVNQSNIYCLYFLESKDLVYIKS